MYWLVSYRWVYTLFSSKLLLSLWPLVSVTILGVTIVTLGMTPVLSGACMLIYGPACPCMCLQASVHLCSAGPFPHFFWNYIPQSKVKLILTISLQKYLINFNYVTVVCIHPSMHLCLCVCVYAFVKCVCMHMYIILCVSAQPEVAAVLDWYSREADPAYLAKGEGGSGRTPGRVRSV